VAQVTAVDSLRSLAGVTTTASRTRASTASPEGTSLYVHVPFCVVKCGYCDFNSYVVEDEAVHDSFLDALDAELARTWPGGRPTTVFLGGGTPSLLDERRLARLFEVVRRTVDFDSCAEVTMEANPESFTLAKARLAHAAGSASACRVSSRGTSHSSTARTRPNAPKKRSRPVVRRASPTSAST
jgi:coproporphyrinogen III oxidase-like Fe-S oxidoreductase